MLGSTYRRAIRYRNAAAFVLAAMIFLAGYKSYAVWQKVSFYGKAAAEQAAGRDIEAEDWYSRAQGISSFDYKETEIDAALAALRPVTELKRLMNSLSSDLSQTAGGSQDFGRLIQAYATYQAKKSEISTQDENAKQKFAELSAAYKLDEQFTAALAQARQVLVKNLQEAMSAQSFDNDEAITYLLQLPASAYKDEKTKKKELNALFQKYDTARLEYWFKEKPFNEVIQEGVRLRQFYTERSLEAAWVLPKLEVYIQSALTKLLNAGDIETFITYAKLYQGTKEIAGASSKVNTFIQTSIRKQTARAEQLASSGKFQEAADLYKKLGEYRDTSKEIRELELKWMTSSPELILNKAVENAKFTHTAGGKGLWGAEYAAVGLTESGKLVFVRLMSDQSLARTEADIGEGLSVTNIRIADELGMNKLPVVQVESESSTRKARYTVYEQTKGSQLHILLDMEADGYTVASPGVLRVSNPSGEGAGREVLYLYSKGKYSLDAGSLTDHTEEPQEPADGSSEPGGSQDGSQGSSDSGEEVPAPDSAGAYQEIDAAELSRQQPGTAVRLSVQISQVRSGTALAEYEGYFIQLTGKYTWKPGKTILVTGKYKGKSEISQGDKRYPAYTVEVSGVQP
ncbi:hypothetical protein [Paenibacillus sp. FJAT-26967]|uniref:hypothetical protein n=1 Tax=Paenibacillus sp. FJAT-26967 TaxID=1729690 RepID=UPI000837DA47|nr:hypothetical protein [Paenibacillus sp. FJAT-26967]